MLRPLGYGHLRPQSRKQRHRNLPLGKIRLIYRTSIVAFENRPTIDVCHDEKVEQDEEEDEAREEEKSREEGESREEEESREEGESREEEVQSRVLALQSQPPHVTSAPGAAINSTVTIKQNQPIVLSIVTAVTCEMSTTTNTTTNATTATTFTDPSDRHKTLSKLEDLSFSSEFRLYNHLSTNLKIKIKKSNSIFLSKIDFQR